MYEAFLKQLVKDGNGAFTVVRIAAETEEALGAKRDIYLADDFQDASAEEYSAQFAARTAPVESAQDQALGDAPDQPEGGEEAKPEAQPEAAQDQPADEQQAAPDQES